ncbi:MAG: succinate dehydrogenase cytochrome b subunit [Flavobacteriales bacterium]|nr:succinate dehydrogenase cytochrome b subunit [Flavobacteriales bacterium]
MAKSALLKSSIAKKYWMALTGLFLCLFLAGHLAGNLQLLFGTPLQFNQYALFMTTNPAVKLLSYVTYISIIFHAIDGIMLARQNNSARPVKYAMDQASANSTWASRNMAVLGTVILVFIVTHMVNFWAKMHFDENMPIATKTISVQGTEREYYISTKIGDYIPVEQFKTAGDTTVMDMANPKPYIIKNRTEVYSAQANVKVAELYKDLYKITIDFFKDPKTGLIATILYVIAMIALGFHLLHGFQSAFQSLGATKFQSGVKAFGKGFAIIVPLLFAIIPVYIHFFK